MGTSPNKEMKIENVFLEHNSATDNALLGYPNEVETIVYWLDINGRRHKYVTRINRIYSLDDIPVHGLDSTPDIFTRLIDYSVEPKQSMTIEVHIPFDPNYPEKSINEFYKMAVLS